MGSDRKIVIVIAKEKKLYQDTVNTWRCRNSLKKALLKLGFAVETYPLQKKDFDHEACLIDRLTSLNPFCIFNLFEGFQDDPLKESQFAVVMEKSGLNFTGNSSRTLSICLDKYKKKFLLEKKGIPVPRGILVKTEKSYDPSHLNFPLFVKSCYGSASIGLDKNSLIVSRKHLFPTLAIKLPEFPQGVILEEFIPGREYAVGFLGRPPYELLGISVLDYWQHEDCLPFLSYDSKWDRNSLEFKKLKPSVGQPLDNKLIKKAVALSREAAEVLNCQSYFRVDLREGSGEIFVLDVNPNPDLNKDAGFMKQAAWRGYRYEEIIEKIINFAGWSKQSRLNSGQKICSSYG